MAEKTGFILFYEMLDNLKYLGNDIAIEVLTALSQYDQGKKVDKLSPQAQFAFNAYIPALKKSKRRWETSVINGSNGGKGKAGDNLDEPDGNLPEPSDNLDEPSDNLGQCVIDNVIVNVNEFSDSDISTADSPSFSTADAVDSKAVIQTSRSSPKPKRANKLELSEDQMPHFHAAKACFETSEKAKALMYQDDNTAAREMKNLKILVIRCTKMVPDNPADFLRNVLEHFRVMTNGKLKGKAVFTPRALITPWIWEMVIDSLPENNVTPDLRESIKGMFKK